MDSIYAKPERRERLVGSLAGVAGGAKEIIRLNKDSLISEHFVRVSFSQVFAVAPTAVKLDEIGRLISSVKLVVSGAQGGELLAVDGLVMPLHSRLYENQVAASVTLGTPTVGEFSFEIHYANDEAKRDLMTALDGDSATQVSLEITFASVSTLILTGGTTPAAITFAAEVLSLDYNPRSFVDADGALLAQYDGIASARHFLKQNTATAAGAGNQEIMLEVGNMTRNVMLVVEDGSNVLSDDIISNVSLVINGVERRVGDFKSFKGLTAARRSLDVVGLALLDWGSDEFGFLNLNGVQQARLVFTFTAAGNVRAVQDYTI